ncbi:MAG: HEPN domain-containing protein [Planctomycetota bacterium]|nr:HEPN domain-containing protein [Planctomycetota bacterium]
MSGDEAVVLVIREWVEKADNDLANAAYTLTMEAECPTDTVCFHAQQCVEKYLKALLVHENTSVPRTHDLRVLMNLLPHALRPDLDESSQDRLTEYATVSRYPGDYEPLPLSEARVAVRIARRIRLSVRRLLPKPALRRKKR